MTVCTTKTIEFTRCKNRKVQANFGGGEITSDAGVMLLNQVDKAINLTERIAATANDPRQKKKIKHTVGDMLRQRIYSLALGYEDLNDHDTLRKDTAVQTAVGKDEDLASSPTLCRFENFADQQMCLDMSKALVDIFIESFEEPPKEIILDFDATDDPVHGNQFGRFYHGYYHGYCFLPLYVFCEKHLLAAYLRPSNIDAAHGSWAVLKLLSDRIKEAWPDTKIIFRADSGFCRHLMMDWCDKNNIDYIIGIAKNSRLESKASDLMEQAILEFENTGEKQRVFGDITYSANTWKYERRIIAKAEYSARGKNPRFIVTSLSGDGQSIYEDQYCARGEAENRIKAQQLDLFADRTSCTNFLPNQIRLLLSGLAYTLIEAMRRLALKDTILSSACCGSIRLKLFKIGAVLLKNTRRIQMLLSSAYPYKEMFYKISYRLGAT
jgi:hypothetical protein